MVFVIALSFTGLFLIFLEFLLPSSIMAIGGALLLLASLLVYYMTFPVDLFFWIYCLFLVVALSSVVTAGRKQAKSSKDKKSER
ncbi:MAG: hypothetical protein Q8L98_00310 [Chlamydiales bacterium]|nr:hypothetical protein [Chlamydiales bacterium]